MTIIEVFSQWRKSILINQFLLLCRDKSATQNRRCKAVYSYTQNNNDELTLAVGDIIEFLGEVISFSLHMQTIAFIFAKNSIFFHSTKQVEEGWWKGKLGTKIGVFPSNFVVNIEHASPILANRRSTGVGKAASESHSMKHKTDISSSREDIVAAVGSAALLEKDAPSLPPKPGTHNKHFHFARGRVTFLLTNFERISF